MQFCQVKINLLKNQIRELTKLSHLNEDVKENYEQKLNMINTEASTIQSTVESIHDPNDLEGHEERTDALLSEEKNILTSLQMDMQRVMYLGIL